MRFAESRILTIDDDKVVGVRTRAIQRSLKEVETLSESDARRILGTIDRVDVGDE